MLGQAEGTAATHSAPGVCLNGGLCLGTSHSLAGYILQKTSDGYDRRPIAFRSPVRCRNRGTKSVTTPPTQQYCQGSECPRLLQTNENRAVARSRATSRFASCFGNRPRFFRRPLLFFLDMPK